MVSVDVNHHVYLITARVPSLPVSLQKQAVFELLPGMD